MSTMPDPAPRGRAIPSGTDRQIRDLRVLVVEDHSFQRWALGSMLKDLGVRSIFEAEDGGSALDLLASLAEPVDLVIADLDMPGMDGMELMRHVAQSGASASVIIVSALHSSVIATTASMATAYGLRVLGTIQKPVEPGKLERILPNVRPKLPRAVPQLEMPRIEELTHALDNDEFEPAFQPIVEVATGMLCGAEALARWRPPGNPLLLAPGPRHDFVRLLEQSGGIERLTHSILAKALDACRRWRSHGVPMGVSVNLSPHVLGDVAFAGRAEELVRSRGLLPRDVVFELTESTDFADLGHALENLSRLRVMGFGLAIDDYGTGYSSAVKLADIAFTQLKIDRSFVATALERESSRVILESSIEIARRFGITSVAEGVESREQWELLAGLGCDRAQGHFVCEPKSTAGLDDWIRHRRRSVDAGAHFAP